MYTLVSRMMSVDYRIWTITTHRGQLIVQAALNARHNNNYNGLQVLLYTGFNTCLSLEDISIKIYVLAHNVASRV